MKILFLTFLVLYQNCSWAIINGVSQNKDFPSVLLVFKNDSHFCTGTFIDEFTILTAAHCLIDKQQWKGFSTDLEFILNSQKSKIIFKQLRNISHPNYSRSIFNSKSDIGIIKVEQKYYLNNFPEISNEKSRKAIYYGCGRFQVKDKINKCFEGINQIFDLFGNLVSWGESSNFSERGYKVSIAPNDSGGALVDFQSKKIIGVHWGTWIALTSRFFLPNLNFSTSLQIEENYHFIKMNMGKNRQ